MLSWVVSVDKGGYPAVPFAMWDRATGISCVRCMESIVKCRNDGWTMTSLANCAALPGATWYTLRVQYRTSVSPSRNDMLYRYWFIVTWYGICWIVVASGPNDV